jgi:tetratricopeptide (TPR) repeat protein
MRTVLAACLTFFFLAAMSDTVPAVQTLIDQGLASIKKGDFDDADKSLNRALQLATAIDDRIQEARAFFYLGYASQQRADTASNEKDRNFDRAHALDYYGHARTLNPHMNGPINNAASILFAQGKETEAAALIDDAIKNKADRFTILAEKLGDYYDQKGDGRHAAKYYGVATTGPNANTARQKLLKRLVAPGAESPDVAGESLKILSDTWRASDIDTTLDGALRVLISAKHDENQTKALFALVAAALAKKNYEENALRQSGIAGNLLRVAERKDCPNCATAAETIRLLYSGILPPLDWWKVEDTFGGEVSPSAAMRALLRTLGNRAMSQKNYKAASLFFDTAARLTSSLDLAAVNSLVAAYYTQQDFSALQKLDAEIEDRLYHKPTNASDTDWTGVFEYHRTIGEIYVSARKWSDPLHPEASAAYHLDQAVKALPRANEQLRKANEPELRSDPHLYDLLAKAYAATSQPPPVGVVPPH